MKIDSILDDEMIQLNEKNLDMLKDRVKSGEITWVLGAGVSVPAGLPQWEMLLAKMWARLWEIEQGKEFDKREKAFVESRAKKMEGIKNVINYRKKLCDAYNGKYKKMFSGMNVLESAEYMWNYIEDLIKNAGTADKELQERVLKALIRESLRIDVNKAELKKRLSDQAVSNLALSLKIRGKGNIITYNYDDVLEFCLQEICGLKPDDVIVICDCDQDKAEKSDKINIHHPHGAIKVIGSDFGKESEHIILTESSYYDMERKVYRWENSVQAKALVETSCIFMGFSGEDYNFRRIIKNVGFQPERDITKHYIFFCIDDVVKNLYDEKVKKRYQQECDKDSGIRALPEQQKSELWENIRKEIIDSEDFAYEGVLLINMLYARYSYWQRHGIIPIWTSFEELPDMVKHIHAIS